MKTLRQLLTEIEHYISSYGSWGIVSPTKGIIYGSKHPTANDHTKLAASTGHKVFDYAEFYHNKGWGNEDEPRLSLRTYGPKAAAAAYKHFDSLPHGRTGMVEHDHYDEANPGDSLRLQSSRMGKRYQVKHSLAVLGGL